MDEVAAARFADLARTFCRDLESGQGSVRWLYRELAALIGAALDLPDGRLESGDVRLDPDGLERDGLRVMAGLRAWLPLDLYWDVSPDEPENPAHAPKPNLSSLFDAVLDIYIELRQGLYLADATSVSAAVGHWESGFRRHWGRHATSALRVLHGQLGLDDSPDCA